MIKIANAPCSWGVLEFELKGEAPNYIQVLDEIKETGYEGTELGDWGFMPTVPNQLKKELNERQLTLVGAFVPVLLKDKSMHINGINFAIKTAKLMRDAGFQDSFIVLADENGSILERTKNAGRIKTEMALSEEELKIFSEGANELAKKVKEETGLRTVFHHHCGGYIETPSEIKILMKYTDPNILGLVLDTGHYKFGGGDPVSALKEFSDRIWHVHFKDCDDRIASLSRNKKWDYFESVRNGVFCELGKGSVDFKSIINELIKINYRGWIVVEQDVLPGMGNPKKYALKNRQFIKSFNL